MKQTWTILETNSLNLIKTFEAVTPSVSETSEVCLVISTFSLTLAIFKFFENELCQCVLWFLGCNKNFLSQVHMLDYPQVPDQPQKC